MPCRVDAAPPTDPPPACAPLRVPEGRVLSAVRRWPWPLPALLAWVLCWALFALLWHVLPPVLALALACGLGLLASAWATGWWRRTLVAAGFPLSLAASGVAALPGWAWLVPLVLLLLLYPLHAWRDAPLFPTPRGALAGLAAVAPLPAGARVLDAGCGLGHGLRALRAAYPQARLEGIEWSVPLWALCALRCPWARVRRADMWKADWRGLGLVYLFQRPESMDRAAAKAQAELAPGAWLVSLEFAVPGWTPAARLQAGPRPVWVYRIPLPPEG